MAHRITMGRGRPETGSIDVSVDGDRQLDLVFMRSGFPTVGIRLTERQAAKLVEAICSEYAPEYAAAKFGRKAVKQ